jgi:TonB family protein
MMTSTNILIASFYSFLIHAGLFLGFFGYFEQTTKPNKILSSPLSVKMLVEDLTPNTQKKNYVKMQPDIYKEPIIESAEIIQEVVKTKSYEVLDSGIDSLLSEEKASDSTYDEDIIKFYNAIKVKIESAWIQPRNIPSNLSCDLKITINPQGRVVGLNLLKSSGNIRFDNSAMQAVRRVETFSIFKEMQREVYEDTFKNIIFRFNPTK